MDQLLNYLHSIHDSKSLNHLVFDGEDCFDKDEFYRRIILENELFIYLLEECTHQEIKSLEDNDLYIKLNQFILWVFANDNYFELDTDEQEILENHQDSIKHMLESTQTHFLESFNFNMQTI